MTNTRRVWGGLAMAAIAFALLAGACSTAKKTPPVVAPSLVQNPGKKLVSVSIANDGAHIEVESAQELVVRLAIGGAAGAEWSLVDLKPGVLTLHSAKFERDLRNVNDTESAGAMVWRFTPAAAGSVTLNFDLRRPRNVAPAVRTVRYTVTVR